MVIMLDIYFEHSLSVLEVVVRRILRSPEDTETQHALCRALREAKLLLGDVLRAYGSAYNVGALSEAVERTATVLPAVSNSPYRESIARHLREIEHRLEPVAARQT